MPPTAKLLAQALFGKKANNALGRAKNSNALNMEVFKKKISVSLNVSCG